MMIAEFTSVDGEGDGDGGQGGGGYKRCPNVH